MGLLASNKNRQVAGGSFVCASCALRIGVGIFTKPRIKRCGDGWRCQWRPTPDLWYDGTHSTPLGAYNLMLKMIFPEHQPKG